MSLEDADIIELTERYNFLIQKYVDLAVELAPKLEKFGKYKRELQLLSVEFVRRGVDVRDPESLTNLVAEELKKREGKQADGTQQSITTS